MNISNLEYELNYVTVSNYVKNFCYIDKEELKNRIYSLFENSKDIFGFQDREFWIFSSPGRTELSGNHTDHNRGLVLAGSINLDTLGVVSRRDDNVIRIFSQNLNEMIEIDLKNDDLEINENEFGSTKALVRGVLRYLKDQGFSLSGFDAFLESKVLIGSGLSSSASFSVLIAKVITFLSGDENTDPVILSIAAQKSENFFFGKPCGLMDQIACAYGGIVSIDFENTQNPQIEHVNVNFSKEGFLLCLVDTKGDHKDLTNEYESITDEMRQISQYFKKDYLRNVDWKDIRENAGSLRNSINDRAILRAYHFYRDNERVEKLIKFLRYNQISDYLNIINESGASSNMYLQNLFSTKNPYKQELSLAVLLTKDFLESKNVRGASRVHGGGFAGTIQSYIPHSVFHDYKSFMEGIFGQDSVMEISIRPMGVTKFF